MDAVIDYLLIGLIVSSILTISEDAHHNLSVLLQTSIQGLLDGKHNHTHALRCDLRSACDPLYHAVNSRVKRLSYFLNKSAIVSVHVSNQPLV